MMNAGMQSLIEACRPMLTSGNNTESVLTFLKESGCSKIESMRVLIELMGLSLGEAKQVVHLSEAWRDTRDRDDSFHESLQRLAERMKDE
jgi:ribosomal protein L7/L12